MAETTLTVEDIKTSLAEMKSAIANAKTDNEAAIKTAVEEQLKLLMPSHPGKTTKRTLKFGDSFAFEPSEALANAPAEFQQKMDEVYIASQILRKNPRELKMWPKFKKMLDDSKMQDFAKALDATTAGGVDEWVPTDLSPNLIEKVRLQLKVLSLFPEIPMPTNPYQLPVEIGNFDTFMHAQQTADTSQTLIPSGDDADVSGLTTFTITNAHGAKVLVSKDATEDSIIAILPFIQSRIILGLAQGREDAVLNGDTTATHQDSDVTDAVSRRKLFKGLRKLSIANSYTRDMSTQSLRNLILMIGDMGVHGVNPSETAWVTSISGLVQLMANVPQFQTLEQMGPNAVILAGQMGQILARPVIVSEYLRSDLDGTGVYSGTGNTKTVLHLVNRNAFALGRRGAVDAETLRELFALSRQICLLASERIDFEPLRPIATNEAVVTGINIG